MGLFGHRLDRRGVAAGLTLADPSAGAGSARTVPTFAEYIPQVLASMPEGSTSDRYGAY
ncbi:hypothetical protein [Nocardia asiatica]|uniref:hypothetical protein n=1 Tax=Nocardia asiatica TaxID=209252 RepID=UPI0002FB1ED9|nr:hypothetical protein [Nocardia asiatica]